MTPPDNQAEWLLAHPEQPSEHNASQQASPTPPPLHSSSNEWLKEILRTFDSDMRSARTDNYGEHIINAKEEAEKGATQAIEAHYATQLSEAYKKGWADGSISSLTGGQE